MHTHAPFPKNIVPKKDEGDWARVREEKEEEEEEEEEEKEVMMLVQ